MPSLPSYAKTTRLRETLLVCVANNPRRGCWRCIRFRQCHHDNAFEGLILVSIFPLRLDRCDSLGIGSEKVRALSQGRCRRSGLTFYLR
jgi:hypothetical protein